jgi:hypothetical protein
MTGPRKLDQSLYVSAPSEGMIMALRFLGKDPNSQQTNSPTLWEDGDTYVVQGWRITDPATLAEIGEVPDHEFVVRIPKRMIQFLPEVSGGGSGGVDH